MGIVEVCVDFSGSDGSDEMEAVLLVPVGIAELVESLQDAILKG